MPAQRSLPHPQKERWQPLRSGFVNVYRYDCEEFHYENGRLLLRGNNGTGKSRVLALQLPFLLDGAVDPERLEPDADASKKIEWNLLMDRYPDRTGYTWIEFGRCEQKISEGEGQGQEHFLTLGCGLSAAEGQTGVRLWFFITAQRIGEQLDLVGEGRQVLGKDRLRERIGTAGEVFDSAGPYRRAVDEKLFRLGEYRYASLMNLLIQLRRPQLTRRLDEHEFSRALSEALPPVSTNVIATVADAFKNLESDRTLLNSSKSALAAVEDFLSGYKLYTQVAAKRRAERVLKAHHEYEAGMREVLAAEAECDRSLAELARLKAELQRLANRENVLQAEMTALQESPQLKGGKSFEEALRKAVEEKRESDRAAADLVDASRARRACADEHHRLTTGLEQREHELASGEGTAERAAAAAGLEELHFRAFSPLDLRKVDETFLKKAQAITENGIQMQIEKVAHVERHNERIAAAKFQLQRAEAERDQLSGLLHDAREQLNRAQEEHKSAVTDFLTAVSAWTADLTELRTRCDEAVLKSAMDWCERPHGPNPFAIASQNALEQLIADLAESRRDLKQCEKSQAEEPVLDSIDDLLRREGVLRTETHALPTDDGVRAAYDYSVAVARHVDSLRNRILAAEAYVTQKQAQVDEAIDSRDREAKDLGVSKWVEELESLKNAITTYRLAISSLWPAVRSYQEWRDAKRWAWTLVQQATAREARQKEIAEALQRRAVAAEIVRGAVGQAAESGAEEAFQRVARTKYALDRLHNEEKETRRLYHDTEVALTRVDERQRNRTEMLDGQTDRRNNAAAALLTFASTGLIQLAAPGLDVNGLLSSAAEARRPVEMAFELSARLKSIDASDHAWELAQKSVPLQFNILMQALSSQGCQSLATFRDDVFVATAAFSGRECSMEELRQILFDDVTNRQMLSDAREKEILENHLVGQVSNNLCELLHAAEEQVRQMNVELESRPMSTGMKLRFVWRPAEDAPEGMLEARERLMRSNGAWSTEEQQMLGLFLHRQIHAASSDIDGPSWQEVLADALDYRKWHRFGVERYQDGVWKRLTRRTHGTGSGGEKAVALTLPHFAAAAAFYRTADRHSPRLILLDEAFVGIDADMRAKCMGLIHTFDLDFVMTSEREWGCYETLPGLAIYQLSTRPGIDAIGLTCWVWKGPQRNPHTATSDMNATDGGLSLNEVPLPA